MMTKKERFLAAVAAEPVDRLPVTVWTHFGTEHLPGDVTGQINARFAKEYDWDFLKVMNDYRLSFPLIPAVNTEDDIARIKPPASDDRCFREQELVFRTMRQLLGRDYPLIETVFSPIQAVLRSVGEAAIWTLLKHESTTLELLQQMTDAICRHLERCSNEGITGIYLSVDWARTEDSGSITREQFDKFVKPFDLQVLRAAERLNLVKIVHVHGHNLEFARVSEYTADVWSWSHHHTTPRLEEMKPTAPGKVSVMGGLNRERLSRQTTDEVNRDLHDIVEKVGTTGLLIAPGCTAATDTPRRLLKHIVSSVRSLTV